MASKRKKSMAQPSTAPHSDLSTNITRPTTTHRSSRRKLNKDSVEERGFSSLRDLGESRHTHGEDTSSIANNEEVVHRALRELGEMEEKLLIAVKKQRQAVESSQLNEDGNRGEVVAKRNAVRPSQEVTSIRATGAEEPAEHAPLSANDGDLAMRDMQEAKEESGSAERGARRPPPINSDKLPLPWKGRLGYACLNTYLRTSNPPVFSSRTCRMGSIVEHRHPLADPSQPEHPTKNRPDKDQPADVERGLRYVHALGLANARDIPKMVRWNDKFGIKFMRLSSEMFPFASHKELGYKLAPFAAEALAEAGRVAGNLGHRLTTHPGQFTQIGSPRKEVVEAAIRDLDYHNELLSLLKLPEQANRDAVMILHMGGVYGDKEATLDRFRENYRRLSEGVKARLVLENDDVSWSVHDLLPICEELNIPMVLDYHHHNIIFNPVIREGTRDVLTLYDRIRATWTRKNIRQKMHYSEQTCGAVTLRERRKHSPRVRTLPPCPNDMDLMIEAKDKEQAVFELMRTFKLPGWDSFNDVVPYERDDESKKAIMKPKSKNKKAKKRKKEKEEGDDGTEDAEQSDGVEVPEKVVSEGDFGMGGPDHRVYWPQGMEEWLKPKKREVKPKKGQNDKFGWGAEVVDKRKKVAKMDNGDEDEDEEDGDYEKC